MIAYGYRKAHKIQDFSIEKANFPKPEPGPLDLLVRLKSVSFNPIDCKVRQQKDPNEGELKVLGWDAAGIVEETGSGVKGFQAGDAVFYAGDLTRQGSNAELQTVDYRIVGKKPKNMNFTQAAALPLTSITAHEALFEQGFEYTPDTKVLVIGGAGGVGSMATQLLKATTQSTVITTASRRETIDWCQKMGADFVIGRNIKEDLQENGLDNVDIVFSTTHTGTYLDTIREVLRPFGSLVLIDAPEKLDIASFRQKALNVHWELMIAKTMYDLHPEQQGDFLNHLADLAEQEKVRSTLNKTLSNSVESIKQAHELLESGKAVGKIVMDW